MDIKQLQEESYAYAKGNGFWEEKFETAVPSKLMLVVSELSEALEEWRDGKLEAYWSGDDYKPEGFGIELADAIIRICDLAEAGGISLERMIALKMEYNKTRPFRHGNKRA